MDNGSSLPPSSRSGPLRVRGRGAGAGGAVCWSGSAPNYRRIVRWTIPALLAMALGAGVGVGVAAMIHVPRVESLASFSPARITQLYDRQGQVFASYARQRRIVLRPEQIPPRMRDALVAVEDKNFYRHGGLDAWGVLRAAINNFRAGRREEGASTLTMQLARQLFSLNPGKKWKRKIEEAFIAVELEKTYTKDQLLALYLNVIFLGHNQYGVEAAAKYYFGKSVSELSIAQAATLAGIYQLPSRYSPYRNPTAVITRRNHVIDRMLEEDFITREEHGAALAEPLDVVAHGPKDEVGSYFSEEVRRMVEAKHGSSMLLERGLQVETTLDPTIQLAAERAVHRGLVRLDHLKGWRGPHRQLFAPNLEAEELPSWTEGRIVGEDWFEGIVLESTATEARIKHQDEILTLTPAGMKWTNKGTPNRILKRGDVAWFRIGEPEKDKPPILLLEQEPRLQGAAIVVEQATGAVRAMVGGWDFGRSQFNRATQAKRQVGSAFKMFVYGAALEAGYKPSDTVFDAPVFFKGADGKLSYSPSNYYPTYYGIVTLSKALENSYNVSAVKVMDMVGIDKVIDLAHRAGIKSELPPYPSLALGSADITPMEMVAAYASIANGGRYLEPYLIERIRMPEGDTIEEHHGRVQEVMDPQTAYVLTHMLEGVVDRGTARALSDLDIDIAGKTGTTNDYSNAWFIGFTPNYTLLIWVGYDTPHSMGRGMAGDKVAVPIWKELAKEGLTEGWLATGDRFAVPSGVSFAWVDRTTGRRILDETPGGMKAAFVAGGAEESESATSEDPISSLPWYQQRAFYQGRPGEKMPEDTPPGAEDPPSEAPPPEDDGGTSGPPPPLR